MSKTSKYDFFFILGRPRSGTTLLMSLLDAHPNTLIPVEIPIIPDLSLKYGKRRNWDNSSLNAFYNDLQSENFYNKYSIKDLPFNFELIKNQILSSPPNTEFQDLIKIVYSNYQSWFPKKEIKLLGDKNPSSSKDVKYYLTAFPEAKFIHIRRDYRDHALSMLNAGFGIQNLAFISYRWKKNLQIISTYVNQNPQRFLQIRYEDLAAEPQKILKEVCQFFQLDFDPGMLEFYRHTNSAKLYPEHLMKEYQASLLKPISTKNIGVWRQKMTPENIKLCDGMVGSYAEKFGYERKYKSFVFKAFLFKIIIQTRRTILQIIGIFVRFLPLSARLKVKYRKSVLS